MTIAIYAGKAYTNNIFREGIMQLAFSRPGDNFLIFCSRRQISFSTPGNVVFKTLPALPTNRYSRWLWRNFRLPALLKKHQAEAFLSLEGGASSKTGVTQIAWLVHTRLAPQQVKQMAGSNTAWSFCVSAFPSVYKSLQDIVPVKKNVLSNFGIAGEIKVFTDAQKLMARETYASGTLYFTCLVTGATMEQLFMLLKGFSKCKEWLKTSTKLVLLYSAGEPMPEVKQMHLYKYKNDVIFHSYKDSAGCHQVIAASLALVILAENEEAIISGYAAMRMEVPVISTDTNLYRENFSEAALYVKPDATSISGAFTQVYKDEAFVQSLIHKGIRQVENFTWEYTTSILVKTLFPSPVV
ncbi:MAG: glycosyltransferase [Ferruginibacter sp.]